MNNLIVIENGKITTYNLDDKLAWEVGRATSASKPDIALFTLTISRKHGRFVNEDGVWFYVDAYSKNGTFYNNRHLEPGISGRTVPTLLSDGDILLFGVPEKSISVQTAWAMYTERDLDSQWRVEDTAGMTRLGLSSEQDSISVSCPDKGFVWETNEGMAIYMGNVTFLNGNISIQGE